MPDEVRGPNGQGRSARSCLVLRPEQAEFQARILGQPLESSGPRRERHAASGPIEIVGPGWRGSEGRKSQGEGLGSRPAPRSQLRRISLVGPACQDDPDAVGTTPVMKQGRGVDAGPHASPPGVPPIAEVGAVGFQSLADRARRGMERVARGSGGARRPRPPRRGTGREGPPRTPPGRGSEGRPGRPTRRTPRRVEARHRPDRPPKTAARPTTVCSSAWRSRPLGMNRLLARRKSGDLPEPGEISPARPRGRSPRATRAQEIGGHGTRRLEGICVEVKVPSVPYVLGGIDRPTGRHESGDRRRGLWRSWRSCQVLSVRAGRPREPPILLVPDPSNC